MPKYVYKCNECGEHFEVYHGMNETHEKCIYCSAIGLNRVPQMPFLKRSVEPKGDKVGDRVEAAIEENRAILKQAKEQASKEFYKDDN
jgi:putative FmdB family regulatory protein